MDARINDTQDRLPQTPDGCAIACASMALHAIHDMPVLEVYDELYRRLNPAGVGVKLHVLAEFIQRRYRKVVQAGRHSDLSHVLGFGRLGALTIGVRPEHLYTNVQPGSLHAVYVAATEHPFPGFGDVPAAWRPTLPFTAPPDIIDPAPCAPARRAWTYEDLTLAYTGDWLLVPSP